MRGATGPLSLVAGKGAFTLIEMLVVMVILGVIVGLALPMYSKYVATSRQQDAKSQLTAIRQAQEIYKLQYGSYTTDTSFLSNWKGMLGKYTFSVTNATSTAFTARASGNIDSDATTDVWTINESGNLVNTTNDVED